MCTHLDQDYLQLYHTVHETETSAVRLQRDKILVFLLADEKKQQSGLKEEKKQLLETAGMT